MAITDDLFVSFSYNAATQELTATPESGTPTILSIPRVLDLEEQDSTKISYIKNLPALTEVLDEAERDAIVASDRHLAKFASGRVDSYDSATNSWVTVFDTPDTTTIQIPAYVENQTYAQGEVAQLNGVWYQAIHESSEQPPTKDWSVVTIDDMVGTRALNCPKTKPITTVPTSPDLDVDNSQTLEMSLTMSEQILVDTSSVQMEPTLEVDNTQTFEMTLATSDVILADLTTEQMEPTLEVDNTQTFEMSLATSDVILADLTTEQMEPTLEIDNTQTFEMSLHVTEQILVVDPTTEQMEPDLEVDGSQAFEMSLVMARGYELDNIGPNMLYYLNNGGNLDLISMHPAILSGTSYPHNVGSVGYTCTTAVLDRQDEAFVNNSILNIHLVCSNYYQTGQVYHVKNTAGDDVFRIHNNGTGFHVTGAADPDGTFVETTVTGLDGQEYDTTIESPPVVTQTVVPYEPGSWTTRLTITNVSEGLFKLYSGNSVAKELFFIPYTLYEDGSTNVEAMFLETAPSTIFAANLKVFDGPLSAADVAYLNSIY